jgi:exosortase
MDSLRIPMSAAPRSPLPLFGLAALAALGLIGVLYAGMFKDWWGLWTEPGSYYAHAVFVPFFVAIMIWRKREELARAPWQPSWLGALLLLPAMALLILGKRADVTVIQSFSFVLLLLGSVLLIAGVRKTRILLFPLLFLITMIPLFPDQLINVIAFPIQMKSTQIATFFLNALSLHAVREGTMIQMDSYKMAVEGACSGFKTLVSLLTFSAAFAYLVEGAAWKRWVLFLSQAPLSLLYNSLRITFIGIVGELISTKAALTFHDWSGFIVLIMAFTVLFYMAQLLRCDSFLGIPFNDDTPGTSTPSQTEASREVPKPAEAGPAWWQEIREWRPTNGQLRRTLPFVLLIGLMLLSTLGAQGLFVKKVTQQPPIATAQVPLTLAAGGYTWQADTSDRLLDKLTPDIQEQLNPTRVINRDYTGTDGGLIQFFVTAGNARWTFHDPHNCSLGSAATLQDIGVTEIPTARGPLRVLEAHFVTANNKEPTLMMFCYVVPGGILQRTEQVHKQLVLQTFLGDEGKPSYFLRFMQRTPGVTEEKRQQLIRFIAAMWEQVGPVMQGEQPASYEPPPVPYKPDSAAS